MRPLALTLALTLALPAAAQEVPLSAPTVDRLKVERGWLRGADGRMYEVKGGGWVAEETLVADGKEREQLRTENASLRESALKGGGFPMVETGAALVLGVLLGLVIHRQLAQQK